jgi:uncharacterized protein YqjF (DUF2071 family)
MTTSAYWIGVASRDHVQRGLEGGFCQLGHGKHAPVKRLNPGDRIVYYSPKETLEGGAPVQAFTAIGKIADRDPYLVQMTAEFEAYRRDVKWWKAKEAKITPLIPQLTFIKDPAKWGYPFMRGSFKISADDFLVIAQAMGVNRAL